MTKFYELPEQPSYYIKHFKTLANFFSWADRLCLTWSYTSEDRFSHYSSQKFQNGVFRRLQFTADNIADRHDYRRFRRTWQRESNRARGQSPWRWPWQTWSFLSDGRAERISWWPSLEGNGQVNIVLWQLSNRYLESVERGSLTELLYFFNLSILEQHLNSEN